MVIESYIGGELSIDHGKMLIAVFLQVESFFFSNFSIFSK